jgi:hypothetical protein
MENLHACHPEESGEHDLWASSDPRAATAKAVGIMLVSVGATGHQRVDSDPTGGEAVAP